LDRLENSLRPHSGEKYLKGISRRYAPVWLRAGSLCGSVKVISRLTFRQDGVPPDREHPPMVAIAKTLRQFFDLSIDHRRSFLRKPSSDRRQTILEEVVLPSGASAELKGNAIEHLPPSCSNPGKPLFLRRWKFWIHYKGAHTLQKLNRPLFFSEGSIAKAFVASTVQSSEVKERIVIGRSRGLHQGSKIRQVRTLHEKQEMMDDLSQLRAASTISELCPSLEPDAGHLGKRPA
jgi:hypothetical protein